MELNEKKVKILEVAEELFAQNGFSGTSVRELAKASGVNIAMINYYFESKEKLLMAIFHYRSDYLKSRIEDLMNDSVLSNWQKLDFLIDEYILKFTSNKSLHRIILREQGLGNNQELMDFINERKLKHFHIICDFIKKGQENGDFKADVDTVMLYTILPSITKHMMFNEDFLQSILKQETGEEPAEGELADKTKNYIKKLFRLILEKN